MLFAIVLVIIIIIIIVCVMCKKCKGKKCEEKSLIKLARKGGKHIDSSSPFAPKIGVKSHTYSTVGMAGREDRISTYDSIPHEPIANFTWPLELLSPVLDQGSCGSCWAFATATTLSDRIRIATKGELLKDDYISPYDVAACNMCAFTIRYNSARDKASKECTGVCNGNYIDSALEYLCREGGIAITADPEGSSKEYVCTARRQTSPSILYRGQMKYLLSANDLWNGPGTPPSSAKEKLDANVANIEKDIRKFGPVCAGIKIYKTVNPRNALASYTSGIYNYQPTSEDEFEGYHAVSITSWGPDYWIVRNSWGRNWGLNGYFLVPKGINFLGIEEDVWGILPDVKPRVIDTTGKAKKNLHIQNEITAFRSMNNKRGKRNNRFSGSIGKDGRLTVKIGGVDPSETTGSEYTTKREAERQDD